MSHPQGVGYSGGGECIGCCLGGFCHISNTLYVCTISQQHFGTRLLYEQDHTAEVLGKRVAQLGLRCSSVNKT